jgi:hypothetical protein
MKQQQVLDMNAPIVCMTGGDGIWSSVKKNVRIMHVKIHTLLPEFKSGLMNAYFDTKLWNVNEDGLVYTDDAWLNAFRAALHDRHGIPLDIVQTISYTEQGMQGWDYVSLEFGERFYNFINAAD